jgi:hypothetical protein
MKSKPWKLGKSASVNRVSQDWKSKMRKMYPDLMHDSGFDFQFKLENRKPADILDSFHSVENAERGERLSSMVPLEAGRKSDHSFLALRVMPKGQVHGEGEA